MVDDLGRVGSGADVVIVGAGSAGVPLAARLSEDPARSVVLLDAGPELGADLGTDPGVSGAGGALDADSLAAAYDPGRSDGRSVDLGGGRIVELRRGRVVGGSSAVNGAYFLRGRPEDFDRWRETTSADWSAEKVLASFVRLEHDLDLGHRPGHGSEGPMPVRRDLRLSRVSEAFFAASAGAGYRESDDLNGPTTADPGPGEFGVIPRNIGSSPPSPSVGPAAMGRGAVRVSVADAYLARHRDRANLTVRGGNTVRRVLVSDGRAVGIEIDDGHGGRPVIEADRVVLSAGAVGSAELLLRSGIGPADQLRRAGLEVVADLPVGAAIFDHPCIDLMFRPGPAVADPDSASFMQGALHLADGVEIMATRVPYGVATGTEPADDLLSLRVTLMRTLSRGRLTLHPPGVPSEPRLVYDSLSVAADRALARGAVRVACGLAAAPAMAALVEQWFGPSPAELRSDALLDLWIATHLGTAFHLCGTAPMGSARDPRAVVDPLLRVCGIEGLSVVDASVIPEPLSRGPAATAIMIGEHAATLFDR